MATTSTKYRVESVQSVDLTAKLGDWTIRSGPLYARLADAIADCVAYGMLSNERLPAERELAEHLDVSRGTVIAAYDALRVRGLACSRRGSGTFLTTSRASADSHEAPIFAKLMDADQAPIDMSMAALRTPEILADAHVSLLDSLRLFPSHGYAPLGAHALRVAIAEHLSARRAGPTEPRQILVTAGGQGALSLIANGLLRPGDRVLVEAPTYPGAIEVFSRAGARIEALERDHAGVLRDSLEHALDAGPARLLYLVPSCHNPTGTTMSEQRRHEVLRITQARGVLTVEDTAMSELTSQQLPPDLSALAHEHVISVGSLSKCYWAGLRVGWIRAAPEIVQRLGRLRVAMDLGGPLLEQALALTIFSDFDRLTAPTRSAAEERVAVLVEQLHEHLPDWEFHEPRGGWSVWATMPWGNADRFAQLALRHGVAVSAGGAMAPDDRFSGHVRLSAGSATPQIIHGIQLLAEAWAQMATAPERSADAIDILV
ncbi:MAG: PLP-dependent aminotransferase family protein [Actinomycetota bacterium]|nr:PLP-dependent aminotransferase family protein [Actinomycetota bacterium]